MGPRLRTIPGLMAGIGVLSLTASSACGGSDAEPVAAAKAALHAQGASAYKAPSYIRPITETYAQPPAESGEARRYLIHFVDPPLSCYHGGIAGLAATSTSGKGHPDLYSPASHAYTRYLTRQQQRGVEAITRATGKSEVLASYHLAANAVVMRLRPTEAARINGLPEVMLVEPDEMLELTTDRGPEFVGAAGVWQAANPDTGTYGEGVVVGVIDTGIAIPGAGEASHPSFRTLDDDGFVSTNPLGEGVYLGGCIEHPEWCNSKVIGVYSFLQGQPVPGEDPFAPTTDPIWRYKDINGHGSHVASTAAGNLLRGLPLIDASGNPSSAYTYPRISGVAPRASIVSYKVCAAGCSPADIVAAVEQAIADGVVDVLNHSISSPRGSPWQGSQSLAFFAAREAGIFVASSAGNSGPRPGTAAVVGNAPWVASVAASTHDRGVSSKQLKSLAGGDTPPPADIQGEGLTAGMSGRIVYAGDFPVGNPGEPNHDEPEQCLEPFPHGTFEADMIVLCDRGAIARVQKGLNVLSGGAGGLILANVVGGLSSTVADPHALPAIHVDAAAGTALRAWLASGTGHQGTITGASITIDPNNGDVMAAFSSRGPYTDWNMLAPVVAAPGVSIFAAGPGDPMFMQISGTSMASPHVAGAAALLKAAHPDWTDAEILSAFMTTGQTRMRKEDRQTPADAFDFGGGRIQVDQASRVGLLLDETPDGFLAADPARGGDPKDMNVAALVNQGCVAHCTFERTVKATTAGSWSVQGSAFVQIEPSAFSLSAGQSQTLTITVDATGLTRGQYNFGQLRLVPSSSSLPVQTVQAAIYPRRTTLDAINVDATRNAGSHLVPDVRAIPIEQLSHQLAGLAKADQQPFSLAGDSQNGTPYDDLSDGAAYTLVPFPDGALRFIAETLESSSPDIDLRVGLDLNGDGKPSRGEEFCASTSPTAREVCNFNLGGRYAGLPPFWVLLQNWKASAPDATDSVTLAVTSLGTGAAGNLQVTGPDGAVAAGEPFDLRVHYDEAMAAGDLFYGELSLYTSSTQNRGTLLTEVPVRLVRGADDVSIQTPDKAKLDATVPISVAVQPNRSHEDRRYQIRIPLPAGLRYLEGSGGALNDGAVEFELTQPSLSGAAEAGEATELGFLVQVGDEAAGETLVVTSVDTVDNPSSREHYSTSSMRVASYRFVGFLDELGEQTQHEQDDELGIEFRLFDPKRERFITHAPAELALNNGAGAPVHTGTFQPDDNTYSYELNTEAMAPGLYTVTAKVDGFDYSTQLELTPDD